MRCCFKALSNTVALIIGSVVIISILLPFLISLERMNNLMGVYESNYMEYYSEKNTEQVDFKLDLLGEIPRYKIINYGTLPAKIVRVWVLEDPERGIMRSVSVDILLTPGQEYDLIQLLDQLRNVLNKDLSPDMILSLVTSRGNVILIRQNILSLNIVRTIYSVETPDFRPDRSFLYWNFTQLINTGRIYGKYSLSDSGCGGNGFVGLDYLKDPYGRILYPTKLLFVKDTSGNVITFYLSSGIACQKYLFRQLIKPETNNIRIFFRFIALLNSFYSSTYDYDRWRFTVQFRLANGSYIYSSSYTYLLQIYGRGSFILMTTGELAHYVDIDLSGASSDRIYDLEIIITIEQYAGRIISSKVGLDYLVFQGASVLSS